MTNRALLMQSAKNDHQTAVYGGRVASHGRWAIPPLNQLPTVFRHAVDVQLGEELPALVERVEGRVSPTAKEDELVVMEDKGGTGFWTRIGTN